MIKIRPIFLSNTNTMDKTQTLILKMLVISKIIIKFKKILLDAYYKNDAKNFLNYGQL